MRSNIMADQSQGVICSLALSKSSDPLNVITDKTDQLFQIAK